MDADNESEAGSVEAREGEGRRDYEPPRITWREPYEPLSFGYSCAKQSGNPGCNPGPYTS